jgi:hypothetical protein
LIIDINLSEEGEELWIEEESSISSDLMSLRQDILNRDYRALFIIWLHIKNLEYKHGHIDLQEGIPVELIPGNLDTLNSGLRALAGLYDVDMDWVSRASKFSGLEPSKEFQYEDQICKLSNAKKEEFLKRILRGRSPFKDKARQRT